MERPRRAISPQCWSDSSEGERDRSMHDSVLEFSHQRSSHPRKGPQCPYSVAGWQQSVGSVALLQVWGWVSELSSWDRWPATIPVVCRAHYGHHTSYYRIPHMQRIQRLCHAILSLSLRKPVWVSSKSISMKASAL